MDDPTTRRDKPSDVSPINKVKSMKYRLVKNEIEPTNTEKRKG